jgi:hypothetical protein
MHRLMPALNLLPDKNTLPFHTMVEAREKDKIYLS